MKPLLLVCLAACAASSPSDDPNDYAVRTDVEYTPVLSEPRWVTNVPVDLRTSMNNVSIASFGGRLYIAFRTAPTHFASPQAAMHLLSTDDGGHTWRKEQSYLMESDVREPHLYAVNDRLYFNFFQLSANPLSFLPLAFWRTKRYPSGGWSEPGYAGEPGEIPWNVKVRNGVAWMTSYKGNHYLNGQPNIEVYFKTSSDGENFTTLGTVYKGGVSEVAFEFTAEGDLWAVTRNEDGDQSGFGSHVCFARKDNLGSWDCPAKSNPLRYDSPQMFRHGKDIYLIARRDPDGPYDLGHAELSFDEQKTLNLIGYSNRRKRSALYKLNIETRAFDLVFDIPGTGDTAFPSVQRLSANHFLIANYTSPLDTDMTWLEGQTSDLGTRVYLADLTFQ